MDYARSDGSGTDDDMPPSYRNRSRRGRRLSGNRKYSNNTLPHYRGQNDIESQIHLLEQEAYISVLRAFKAQSDAITWEKEGLITELRKELRLSDDEHRELLSKVNADDVLKNIREWRQAYGPQSRLHSNAHNVHDSLVSPTFSGPRKRQKTFRSLSMNSHAVTRPSSSATFVSPRSKWPSSVCQCYFNIFHLVLLAVLFDIFPLGGQKLTAVSTMKSLQTPPTNRIFSGVFTSTEPVSYNQLVGKKVWSLWSEDNMFHEAVITDYNAVEGTHALVYDINTEREQSEWVDLKKIPPDALRWEAPGIGNPTSQAHVEREEVLNHQPSKDLGTLLNQPENIDGDEIEIINTETVINEVETVIAQTHPDPLDIAKIKKTLREHEQALLNAIAKLTEASGGENVYAASLYGNINLGI